MFLEESQNFNENTQIKTFWRMQCNNGSYYVQSIKSRFQKTRHCRTDWKIKFHLLETLWMGERIFTHTLQLHTLSLLNYRSE